MCQFNCVLHIDVDISFGNAIRTNEGNIERGRNSVCDMALVLFDSVSVVLCGILRVYDNAVECARMAIKQRINKH